MGDQPRVPDSESASKETRDWLGLSETQFKHIVALFIAGVTFFGTIVAALQVDASARSATADRDSRTYTLMGVGKGDAGIQRYVYERGVFASYSAMATQLALERRLAQEKGSSPNALDNEQAAERLWLVLEDLRSLSELLSPPYYDEATARSDAFQFAVDFLVIPPAVVTEKQSAKREEAEAWGNKSNNYIVTVMVLAVCLFLFGLAIAIGGQVKYLFVAVGSLIAEAACIAVFVTLLLPVPQMSEDAIQRYAQGVGHAYYAWNLELSAAHSQVPQKADQAIASFTEALALRRDYGAAYQARGNAHLIKAEALLFGRGDPVQTKAELDQAVADFKRAIDLGRGNKDGYWNLGWAYFLAKKYPESIAATKEALKLASELKLGLGLNLAANLLGEGKRAEAMQQLEESISWAAQHPLYSDTFYFRQIIRDLDRLREVQPLEGMVEMEKRLKEAFVSLTYRGTSIVEPTGASIGAFEFAQPVFDAQGNVTERKPMTRFPRGTERVDFAFDFKGMPKDSQIVQKVYWQGLEQASLTRIEKWSGGDSGRAVWFLRSPVEHTLAGLLSGHYTVELYIEGELVQSGSFDID